MSGSTRHLGLGTALLLTAAVAVACGDNNTATLGGPSAGGGNWGSSGSLGGSSGAGSSGGLDGGAGTGAVTGLPCDVQKTLEDGCIACHGGTQAPRLLTYADLMAQSTQYAGQTVAQRALARMTATSNPMPPPPAVPPVAAEIQSFQSWVNAGTPMGSTCTNLPDAGSSSGGNFGTPSVCTSNKQGTTQSGGLMDPGRACLACHQQQGGPRFAVGGTVYPTGHEPDQCAGVNGGVTVVITDVNGTVTNLPVNSVGNFYSSSRTATITPPFSAKVTNAAGAVRAMAGTITAGDCNSCHTEAGANGAPGRIMAP